jgi:D-inositol-3-phosphate glycosyltransferase
MRIALVACCGTTPDARPAATVSAGPGAPATGRITSLAQALARQGHRVTVYARKDSAALPTSLILCPGASIEYVTAGPAAPADAEELTAHLPEFASHLARRWRRNRPDVIDAHFWTSGMAALAGARGLDVPVAQTFTSLRATEERNGAAEPGGAPARWRLEPAVARTADLLLATSTQEASDLARFGAPRARIRVVPCGVDTDEFTPEGPVAERGSRTRLLAAQPLGADRELAVALRALTEVSGAELVITGGSGKRGDPASRAVLQAAKKLGIADRVVLTGPVAPADLPALLRSADLMVSTASYEPVGTTALQAMACGTPVVTCAAGAEDDAVVDMTTGMHAPPEQPAELAHKIRNLLTSPVRLEAFGIAATDRARSRYCWDRIARETVAAYDSLPGRAAAVAAAAAAASADDDAASGEAEEAQESRAAKPARRVRTGTRA